MPRKRHLADVRLASLKDIELDCSIID